MTQHDTLLLACGTAENRQMFRSILSESYNLLEAANSKQTIQLLQQNIQCIAAVILDITEPSAIDQEMFTDPKNQDLLAQVPVIVIIPDDTHASLGAAFGFGAADAIPLYYDSYAFVHRIENIIQLHLHKQRLETLVQEQEDALRHSNDLMVDALSSIIEYRNMESGQHILRIRHFTQILLEELAVFCPEYNLTESLIRIISSASVLHDIGKITIPDAILNKPGKLTAEEMAIMKTHAQTGCQLLENLGQVGNEEYLKYAHNICHYHHERWDGKGYPEGLSGDDIPICAQVVGLADAYDALTTKRVYKDAYPFDSAVNMIVKGECGVFSPKLLECFKHVAPQYEDLAKSFADGLSPEEGTFDTQLPPASTVQEKDSLVRTWSKYQALIHYANAFLLELDLDNSLFHLIYNPFPEMVSFHDVSTFADIVQLLLDELVVPEQKDRMRQFLQQDISAFMAAGLRRVNYHFRFRSKQVPQGEDFEVTLLRFNPSDITRNTLAVLCRKSETSAQTQMQLRTLADLATYDVTETAFYCRFDHDFTLIDTEKGTAELAGYTAHELKTRFGNRAIELVFPEDRELVRNQFHQQLQQGLTVQFEHRVVHKNGNVFWVLNKSHLITDRNGQEVLSCYLMDISATKQEIDTLNQKLQRYEIILSQTENVLFEWDVGNDEVIFSDTWEKLFGVQPTFINAQTSLWENSSFHPDDIPLVLDRIADLENGSSYEMAEVRIANVYGRYLWCRFRASAIRDQEGNLQKIVGIIINIEAEKQAEQILQARAERDPLTKLLNKNAGRHRAEEYFAQAQGRLNCALLIIDLDDFKLVNDQYGHLFGDTVLTAVAKEIRAQFRGHDIISRIGGDEFMVIMRGVSDYNLVKSRCTRLVDAIQRLFRSQYHNFPLGCSIGVALSPEHGNAYLDLYKLADRALYEAKYRGKNTFVIYDPQDIRMSQQQLPQTAINNKIDSDDQPGLAEDTLVRHAFHRLYTSTDVDAAINDILNMVGRQMNVSRVYIFENSPDNRFCSNTYEWCNEGVVPEIENLQNICYETDIPGYLDGFDEQGVFYCPDINELSQEIYDIVAPQGIKSMLHCAIRDKGIFRGYIGFDECSVNRLWTKEQIQVLTFFSEMLSVFLLKKQAQARTTQRANDLSSILDNQNAWIYIIDPETCQLKYVNAKTKQLAPDVVPGMTCHKAFFNLDQRCENCPARNIIRDKTAASHIHNARFCIDALAEATLIQWDGQQSCLITCREIQNN